MSVVFYRKGLRFSCIQCGRCCRHAPGYVFLTEDDLSGLAQGLEMSRENFIESCCRIIVKDGKSRLSLKEKRNYDCVFWEKDTGCTVYRNRPLQCRSYPFWPQILASRESWEQEGEECPGIGEGALNTKESIEDWLLKRKQSKMISL